MENGPDLTALAPVWAKALKYEGIQSPVQMDLWLDSHRGPANPDNVEAVVRRARGQARLVDLASERGVSHSQVQDMLHRTALHLIVPHLGDVAAWARARSTGVADAGIAELSCTFPEVVALALDGWPNTRAVHVDGTKVIEAHRCWLAGGSRADVAAVLGLSAARLIRQLRSGESELLPRRLTSADLRERYGWPQPTLSLYRRKGLLPPADGKDGSREWWWPATIGAWECAIELHWCYRCSHAFLSAVGLRKHTTTSHG